jgi:anti-sigma-K factor RskA
MPSPFEPSDEEFESVVPTLRSLRDGEPQLERPPESIWDRIEAEIYGDQSENVVSLGSRRRSPRWIPFAAAASLVLVVGAAVAVANRSGDPEPDESLVASAEMARLDGGDVVASAELVSVDDRLELDITMPADMDAGAGYFELWLIDDELTEPVSLGQVTPGTERIALPPGVDPDAYPVVDVSIEEDDGDASHSGDSLLRGRLSV